MKYLALILVFALVACGADGPPQRPDAPEPGINVSGTLEIGVTGGS